MAKFIFMTNEGTTYGEDERGRLEIVENTQVLGTSQGENARNAFLNLICENEWLMNFSFENVFSYKLAEDFEDAVEYFSLNKIKKPANAEALAA